jgi:hypothetical protein
MMMSIVVKLTALHNGGLGSYNKERPKALITLFSGDQNFHLGFGILGNQRECAREQKRSFSTETFGYGYPYQNIYDKINFVSFIAICQKS